MSEESLNYIIVTILEKHGACLHHEITDRAWSRYGVNLRPTMGAIERLFLERIIDRKVIESPYGKPFHFYFLAGTDANEIDPIIDYKLELLWEHSELTQEIGRFGEDLIGRLIKELPYEEVEIRKEKHGNIGLGRMEIDVFGKNVLGYYQNIEIKNRRQPVDTNDIDDVERKASIAHARWDLPVKSALVCSFIYKKALKRASSVNMPVVVTKKVFVPKKYGSFYKDYIKALGSHYFEITDCENPPESLADLILDVIQDHNYDE